MKIILLSHFYPRCKRDYYLSRSRAGLSAAADAHQYAIALGLQSCSDSFEIVNLPAVSHFPIRYKDICQKSEDIEENGLKIHNVGYNNIIEYQFVSRCVNAKRALDRIIKNSEEPIYIVVYGINFAINKAAVDIKHKYPNKVKLCDIIPDLPQDVNTHGSIVSRLLSIIRSLYFKPTEEYFPEFDSYVLLTDYMKEVVNCSPDKYIVSEGIYEEQVTKRIPHQEDPESFVLFYGGMLYEKFGIMNLVKAFRSITNENMKLQLCGYGDCVDRVVELSKIDKRIQYLGVIDRDKVLELQSKASLLINPRIPDGNPFTRYSFPSKTMEYFASGTPTLLYRLEGIPDEYYDYCYSLDAEHTSSVDLANKIIDISKIKVNERLGLAQRARTFVLEKKTPKIAARMICELLSRT